MNIIDYPPLQLDTNLSKEAAFRLLSRREKCYIYIFCVHITVYRHDMLVPMLFVGVLSLVGIPGNILVISVFALNHKSSIRRTILIILAIYDLLVCG
jgi:hypothetical protein